MKKALCLLALTILACSGHAKEIWTVQRVMPVFNKPNDDLRNPVLKLLPGEKCIPLDSSVAKIYAYTLIRCGGKEGWVADDYFLKQAAE